MLKQRVITAVILAVVVIGCIMQEDTVWVRILFAVGLFAATRELLALTLKPAPLLGSLAAGVFVLLFWLSWPLITPPLVYLQSLAGVAMWVLITIGMLFYRHHGNWPLLARVLLLGIGLDLLWICVHALVYLHLRYGGEMLLFLLTLVWVADIGAYFSGRRFGRRKLAPAISPGKTVEGLLGGLCANLLWILVVYQIDMGWDLGLLQFLAIGILTSLVSVVGDLFESVLKREAGVKDSGKSLPGHGGVLDRIDSVIAAAPVFVSGIIIVSQM
jgi:phosphatidate cytidylyltransferase